MEQTLEVTKAFTLITTDGNNTILFAREIEKYLDANSVSMVMIFYSPSMSIDTINSKLERFFKDTIITGCTSAGSTTFAGYIKDGAIAIIFKKSYFDVVAEVLESINDFSMDQKIAKVSEISTKLKNKHGDKANMFAINLVDGMSKCEEVLISGIHDIFYDLPIIGGSAGDNLLFKETKIFMQGKVYSKASIIILIHSHISFKIFSHHNFEPTDTKMVVTSSDSKSRTVYEFNAEPAAIEYARCIGVDVGDLNEVCFAANPTVVCIDNKYFCRSIQKINQDNSLTFYCAVEDGIILHTASPKDMTLELKKMINAVDDELNGISCIVAFDCILRLIDGRTREINKSINKVFRERNIMVFHTYGEQLNNLHLNQTFTGIAFAKQ